MLRWMSRSDGALVLDDHVIVLFGALGDLSTRKLLPGLFHLDRAELIPARYKLIGTSRKGGTDEEFRAWRVMRSAMRPARTWERFAQALSATAFSTHEPEPLQSAAARRRGRTGWPPATPAPGERADAGEVAPQEPFRAGFSTPEPRYTRE
jgi:glucose-6-phosphate 1-dehydrogenase